MNKRIQRQNVEISQKTDMGQITKVFDQLKRFAEYEDLKQLHKLVIPEISKFESKIMMF